MNTTDQEPKLVPIVGLLRSQAATVARGVLALPASLKVSTEALQGRHAGGALLLRVEQADSPPLELELAEHQADSRSYASGGGVQLSYRRLRDGSDPHEQPQLAQLLAALQQRVRGLDAERGAELRRALAIPKQYAAVEDWMYRQVTAVGSVRREGHLRLGFRCNQDCGFCWQARDWPDPPAEMYLKWVDAMADAGIKSLVISGGEPTLYRALPEVVAHAHQQRSMHVTLETNAIRFAKPEFTRTLVDAGLSHAFVSYHCADPTISDQMTRAPGTHGRTERGLLELLAAGVSVIVNSVVDSRNVEHLEAHAARVLEAFHAPYPEHLIAVTYSHPCTYFDPELFRETSVDLELARPHLTRAARLLLDAGVPVIADGSCGFPPCTFRDVPAVLRLLDAESFLGVARDGHVFGRECDKCAMRPHCLGFRTEYVERHGMSGVSAFAEVPAEARSPEETLLTLTGQAK